MSESSRNGLNDRIEELYQTSGVGPVVETLTETLMERLADGSACALKVSLKEFKRLLADELSARHESDRDDSSVSIAVG